VKYCDTCRSAYPNDFTTCPRDQAALRATADLVPGMVLRGKYEVLEKVGSGGMATVYRAKHLAFGEIRAIKVVSARLCDDEGFLNRFRTEAVVTRRLQHPNAVRVDDLDVTEDGRPFIVMEHVTGRNLREVIRDEGAIPVARAAEIGRQVALALGAAHALGITHRDIKPDNILLTTTADGQALAKVLDFGIAKVREGAFDVGPGYTPTETGMVVGTPQYVSPEQAMGRRGDQLDGRSDLYSLGITLYEMITGRLPFESTTPMEMILHHVQTPPPPPQKMRPDLALPPAVGTVLMRALQKEPGRRFRTAEEMAAALEPLTILPDTLVSRRAGTPMPATLVKGPSPSTAIEVEPIVTPRPRPGTSPTRVRPPAAAPPEEEAERTSSTSALVGSALVVLVVVGAIAWRANARARPREAAIPAAVEPAAIGAPAAPGAEAETRVAPAPGTGDADARIQNEIQRLVNSSSMLRSQPVVVEVANGIVTLSGSAADTTSAQLAESFAASVPGVRRVFNTLRVPAAAAAAPAANADAAPAAAEAPPARPTRAEADDARDAVRDLLDKAKREAGAGHFPEATAACEEALRQDPTNAMAHECVERLQSRPGGPPPRPRR
jgi:eukaryotic-like serine/threonine-protein kinase